MEEDYNSDVFLENNLHLKPDNFYGQYGFMTIFEDGKAKNEVRYKLSVKFLQIGDDGNNVFRIEREPIVYINDKAPDTIMEELAVKTSQVIYPLQLAVSDSGKLISVLNFETIGKRWITQKKEIRSYYKGETVEKYLQLNDNTLSSYDFFYKKIKQDWFFQLYFEELYVNYGSNLTIPKKGAYCVAGNAGPVNYEGEQKIEHVTTDKNLPYFVRINGEIKDERCALDLEQELEFPYYRNVYPDQKDLEGNYNLVYALNRKTGIIEGLEAKFETLFLEPKKVTIKCFLLENLVETEQKEEDDMEGLSFWAKFLLKVKKSKL